MKSQPIQSKTNYNHPPKTHTKRNMVTSLIICGSGSLPREENEEHQNHHERTTQSAGSSPRKSSSSRRSRIHNHHKNPYATRGLDKFTALLAEIEEKKQMIYSENNPDEICFVQFDYSKDNNCKPVVIKVKPSKKAEINQAQKKKKDNNHDPDLVKATSFARIDHHDKSEALDHASIQDNNYKNKKRSLKLQKLRKPSCYLPAMVILILIFLALFGRSVAILCTSIGWYAIPTISKRNLGSRRSFKKKGLGGHQVRG